MRIANIDGFHVFAVAVLAILFSLLKRL